MEKMKKILVLISLLLSFTHQTFASEARLIALGLDELDNEGSYYISDSRNIFLNAANVNNYSDRVMLELGGIGRTVGPSATINADNETKAQGGFLMSAHGFVYGVYLGMESNQSSLLRIASTSAAGAMGYGTSRLPTADNQIDLFFGGETSVKWGVALIYLNNEDKQNKQKESASAVKLGVMGDKWDFHANISTGNKAERTEDITVGALPMQTDVKTEFKGKFGIQTGASYVLGDGHRIYASFKNFSWEQMDGYIYATFWNTTPGLGTMAKAGQAKTDGKFTTIIVGYGKEHEVTSTSKLFFNLYAKKLDIELKYAEKAEVDVLNIPLTFGYEAQATSWLTLRGSITQDLYNKRDNKNYLSANPVAQNLIAGVYGAQGKGSLANTTRVQAGASLNFGSLTIDGVIGTTSHDRTGGADANSNTSSGVLSLDNFMTRVGMSYTF